MNRYIETIENCQLCGHDKFETYLDFGNSPLANSLKQNESDLEFHAPLEIVKCSNLKCECFQLKHLVAPEILFSNYFYRSSTGLEKHFADYAKHSVDLFGFKKDDLMVGIGGNTGLLELEFKKLGLKVINVEPATNIANESTQNGVQTYNSFFNFETALAIKDSNKRKARIISCNNCFCHTNLSPIIAGVKCLLDDNGIFIIENAYWLDSVKNKDGFQCYSEHYKYMSIKPLQNFFKLWGLELFRVEFNNMQCGSFRAYIKWAKNTDIKIHPSVKRTINNEERFGLYKRETYIKFVCELDAIKKDLIEILSKAKRAGKTLGIFSVAAKTVLMLQYFGIKDYFKFASDDSNLKYNRYIPGTSIKIITKEDFLDKNFDLILVGGYNFFDQIYKKNRNGSTEWIRVLPKIEVLK